MLILHLATAGFEIVIERSETEQQTSWHSRQHDKDVHVECGCRFQIQRCADGPANGVLPDDAIGLHLVDCLQGSLHRFIVNQLLCRAKLSLALIERRASSPASTNATTFVEVCSTGQPRAAVPPQPCLRGFGGALAFERLLAAYVDLDLLRLGFGFLGKVDLQNALVIVGLHLIRIYRRWKSESAGK